MELELIKQLLIIAIGASIISTATIQKIKEQLKSKLWLYFTSLVVSIGLGILFSICFSEVSIISSVWVGLFTWIGADTIYKAFENKIFTPFSDIVKKDDTKNIVKEDTISIKRDDI
jgi:Na+/melibiose symporter-like transporter